MKTIYDIDVEFNKKLELLKKAKTIIINVRRQAQISECYPIQNSKDMAERVSGVGDKVEEMDT